MTEEDKAIVIKALTMASNRLDAQAAAVKKESFAYGEHIEAAKRMREIRSALSKGQPT